MEYNDVYWYSSVTMKEINESLLQTIRILDRNKVITSPKLYQRPPATIHLIEEWEKLNYPYVLPGDFKTFLL